MSRPAGSGARPAGGSTTTGKPDLTRSPDELPAPRRPAVPVALAVVVRGGRVLLTKRQPGEHLEGLWEFPGGKIVHGERSAVAARRELREEAGLDLAVEAFEPLTFVQHDYGDRRVLLIAFLARASVESAGESDNDAAATITPEGKRRGAAWVPLEDLPSLAMPEANARVIEKLKERLGENLREKLGHKLGIARETGGPAAPSRESGPDR